MQELDGLQLRSNTKDARAGRNTNTSILVAADMHATATLNQQWGWSRSILYVTGDISNLSGTAAYRVSSAGTSWQYHLAVYHKTTRLCIALSAHGSTRAKCIRSNGRIQIRSNTEDARTGRNTNTSILIAADMHATETLKQQCSTFGGVDLFMLRYRLAHKLMDRHGRNAYDPMEEYK